MAIPEIPLTLAEVNALIALQCVETKKTQSPARQRLAEQKLKKLTETRIKLEHEQLRSTVQAPVVLVVKKKPFKI
jgi:hypothetical protein